mmetsp:Transcript_31226/g.47237  ORF Transcript_31226/g.47237 Transcript_31226/m.47237 type:complete len:168 (+) Transcript_31226:307-810(+)
MVTHWQSRWPLCTDSTTTPVTEPSKALISVAASPSLASCGDGICGFSEGILVLKIVLSLKIVTQLNEDWYRVTFNVNALKNVSFYQLEVETSSLAEERFLAKLYTREGSYDRYEGMSQWNLVFEEKTYLPIGEYRVKIPIADSLFTPAGSQRSLYLSFSKGQTIVFD